MLSDTQLQAQLKDQPDEIRAEMLAINEDARPIALQVAILVPILAALLGLRQRVPDAAPSRSGRIRARGDDARVTVRGAIFLGVGSMVGAGIFALLGEAGTVAGVAVWISFLLAGIVAGLLGYTVVKLGVRYPSSGGLIAYLIEGFGNGRLVGIASWLGYMSAIVIVGAMVAVSFGSYATALFIGSDAAPWWDNVFITAVVLVTLAINLIGSRIVDRAQTVVVITELAVFAVFLVVTIPEADWSLLAFSNYPPLSDIIASVALTFFAFMGFSVITFSAGDLADPRRGLPIAMYAALGIAGGCTS